MIINLVKPTIFDKSKIISGVTLKNTNNLHPKGISFLETGDFSNDEIKANIDSLAHTLDIHSDLIILQTQTHSDIVRIVNNDSDVDISDAMITNNRGIIIGARIADCCAILLFDKKTDTIAAIHSGWKGTEQNICRKTIEIMHSRFGCIPTDIIAYLSVCACGTCYEVGEDFKSIFPACTVKRGNDYYFDNRKMIMKQLLEAGLNVNNIEISSECSIHNSNFHSYRRDRSESGRMLAFIGMKN
ncbi:MAG: peptidoglycan editing factor PgeF [Candidatus Kapabacteria bacterium]|nr:peptidoglycan editing factor PgeF [Candidatus Kapabacteria bacterium]